MKQTFFFSVLFILSGQLQAQDRDFANVRIDSLISQMTIGQKVSQLMNNSPALPELGINAYNWWNEGLHGVANIENVTVFPQAIGLAATFNPGLVSRVATAISDEARVKFRQHTIGGLSFWSPNINIFRDPRWGRGQETYGEDPFLTSRMAVSFIKAFQGNDPLYFKLIATPKHYAVHNGPEYLRHHFNVNPSPGDLWNTYLPAFRSSVIEGGAYSVMGAYNSIYNEPACASEMFLKDILRDKWGFKGYVVSDCGAIKDIWLNHQVASDPGQASIMALRAGCDLECGEEYESLVKAIEDGLIAEEEIDSALFRLLKARFLLGEFEKPGCVPFDNIPDSVVDSHSHRALAREAARESIVLLKNEGILPLSNNVGSIAVMGPNSNDHRVLYGNYNGWPSRSVTVLEGMRSKIGSAKVNFIDGVPLVEDRLEIVTSEHMFAPDGKPGLKGEYFANDSLHGEPLIIRRDETVNFIFQDEPLSGMPKDNFSIRWSGSIMAPSSGHYSFGVSADDGCRFYINDSILIDDWNMGGEKLIKCEYFMKAGELYQIKIEYFDWMYRGSVSFSWSPVFLRTGAFGLVDKRFVKTEKGLPGYNLEVYENEYYTGEPSFTSVVDEVDAYQGIPSSDLAPLPIGSKLFARWKAILSPPETAVYNFRITSRDKFRLLLNGKEVQSELLYGRDAQKFVSMDLTLNEEYLLELEYAGTDIYRSVKLEWGKMEMDTFRLDQMVDKTKDDEFIVFVGGISPILEGEEGQTVQSDGFDGGDRLNINLPRVQSYLLNKLSQSGKPVILALMSGSCIAINHEDETLPAIVQTWYGGEEAGNAIADVLFGEYNPAGRLPVSFYKEKKDLATFRDYEMKGKTYRYLEEIPLYPFGHGLSYTSFEYDAIKAPSKSICISTSDTIFIEFELTNTGDRKGEEVVQLYLKHPSNIYPLPIKSLKSFDRIMLEPGQTKKVVLPLRLVDLQVFDNEASDLTIKPGKYEIQIGSSSRDIRLKSEFNLVD